MVFTKRSSLPLSRCQTRLRNLATFSTGSSLLLQMMEGRGRTRSNLYMGSMGQSRGHPIIKRVPTVKKLGRGSSYAQRRSFLTRNNSISTLGWTSNHRFSQTSRRLPSGIHNTSRRLPREIHNTNCPITVMAVTRWTRTMQVIRIKRGGRPSGRSRNESPNPPSIGTKRGTKPCTIWLGR
ncbi:hypothetical protein I3842_16G065100 [Carya illinoinensis]|uniref:Uncharacterized protein n=1 Tax=Carya illinoinensis TaxID=32201 RepID=A0A922D4K2_CARIL|nr:hypothetical protein I3842_16G065100 [Carya illinoinensis]